MATFKYFADLSGQAVELTNIRHDGHISTKAHHFSGLAPDGLMMVATRAVQRKPNPSNHKCDAHCLNATGFLCECACGGKNHGAGTFQCAAEAA